jgi:hypothetical protein
VDADERVDLGPRARREGAAREPATCRMSAAPRPPIDATWVNRPLTASGFHSAKSM